MVESVAEPTSTPLPGDDLGLAKAYDPVAIEAGRYDQWDAAGYFAPNDRTDREPFVVIMPPPNVTGELHIGHALVDDDPGHHDPLAADAGRPDALAARRRPRRHRRPVGGRAGARARKG